MMYFYNFVFAACCFYMVFLYALVIRDDTKFLIQTLPNLNIFGTFQVCRFSTVSTADFLVLGGLFPPSWFS